MITFAPSKTPIMKKFLLGFALMFGMNMAVSAQKFGFVDSQYILENIPEYKSAQQQLDKISLQWQKEIEAKFAEIDKMYKDFQAEAILLSDDMKKKREDEIIDKEKAAKELQKQRFGKGGDLLKRRQELIKPIQDKVYNAIKEISTTKNYAAVFDKSSDLTILFTNPKYDISDAVLEEMGYSPIKGADDANPAGGSGDSDTPKK
jgi:outer membrane protein